MIETTSRLRKMLVEQTQTNQRTTMMVNWKPTEETPREEERKKVNDRENQEIRYVMTQEKDLNKMSKKVSREDNNSKGK